MRDFQRRQHKDSNQQAARIERTNSRTRFNSNNPHAVGGEQVRQRQSRAARRSFCGSSPKPKTVDFSESEETVGLMRIRDACPSRPSWEVIDDPPRFDRQAGRLARTALPSSPVLVR